VVVSADVRDAIHPELTVALGVVGDIAIAQDRGEHLEAAERARELRDVTRLLDGLGWSRGAARMRRVGCGRASRVASAARRLAINASVHLILLQGARTNHRNGVSKSPFRCAVSRLEMHSL
jgi:hypothetical protein